MESFDCIIVGGGILGTSLSYWLSHLYQGRMALIEQDACPAMHTSGRNTGVVHRPFYLNPVKKTVFARSAQISYGLWKEYAVNRKLPWEETGTLEVAVTKDETAVLDQYMQWALENGMNEQELERLNSEQVRKVEPDVHCSGALHIKTEPSVDFAAFTVELKKDAEKRGMEFYFCHELTGIDIKGKELILFFAGNQEPVKTRFLINCAGGKSMDILHLFNSGMNYTDLHFRGEYWEISKEKSNRIKTNIYSVPRHTNLPFLDPHWIVRSDGRREIGPNAVLVAGPQTYRGFFNSPGELLGKVLEKPWQNKIRLFTNPEFLRLAWEEWMSSISKQNTLDRIRRFIPWLEKKDLVSRGTAGVRSSVVNSSGGFVKEAMEITSDLSFHIINYNSPGATGAPAYSAYLADQLARGGHLDVLKKRTSFSDSIQGWDVQKILQQFQS